VGDDTGRLRSVVLDWFERAGRDLPWRRSRDPWAILVSEVMLAQTQVARVIPKWESFLARWPDPEACARASVGDVITAWAGLGYNRRAVFLHRAAGIIADRHSGRVPADLPELLALPGVGAYTARAVLAFAFERPVGVVDTNAARVLARAVAGRRLDDQEAQQLADRLVPPGRAWPWNQAMLDLGAGTCTARRPACDRCPLGPPPVGRAGSTLCAWARRGGPDPARYSAGTSRPQPAFVGSDRQGRGRLIAALAVRRGPGTIPLQAIPSVAGWPADPVRAALVARGLIEDGLAVADPDGGLRLP
jgi:A/G-specific adenine glycosylase